MKDQCTPIVHTVWTGMGINLPLSNELVGFYIPLRDSVYSTLLAPRDMEGPSPSLGPLPFPWRAPVHIYLFIMKSYTRYSKNKPARRCKLPHWARANAKWILVQI